MLFFNEELKKNRLMCTAVHKLPEKSIFSFIYYLKLMLDQLLAPTILPTKGKQGSSWIIIGKCLAAKFYPFKLNSDRLFRLKCLVIKRTIKLITLTRKNVYRWPHMLYTLHNSFVIFFGREISFYTIPITSNCFLNEKDFNLWLIKIYFNKINSVYKNICTF